MKTLKTLLKKYEDLTIYFLVAVLLVGLVALMLWSETGATVFRTIAACSGFGLPIALGLALYAMTLED